MLYICGRKVKVKIGTKTQTVNICTDKNIHGVYDYVVRIRPPSLTEDMLAQHEFKSIHEIVQFLQREYHGEVERRPSERINATNLHHPEDHKDNAEEKKSLLSTWEQQAVSAVDGAIDQFILEFVEFPYLHRVEHSIHCELYKILTSRRIFSRTCSMGQWRSQPVHKEWPEFKPRPEKGNRRGNFDLCIISPELLKSCSFKEFRYGHIKPSIVIELGLDYGLSHLRDDAAKLVNSGVSNSYLVHLVRQEFADDFNALERFLLDTPMKTAYARVTSSKAFFKLVKDNCISSTYL